MTEDVKAKVLAVALTLAARQPEARPGFAARAIARESVSARTRPGPSAPRAIGASRKI